MCFDVMFTFSDLDPIPPMVDTDHGQVKDGYQQSLTMNARHKRSMIIIEQHMKE